MPQQIDAFQLFQHWQNRSGGGNLIGMGKIQCIHGYEDITSIENLLEAWKEFVRGKRRRKDVQEFQRDLMGNIISPHRDLSQKRYRHAGYEAFTISDPKSRSIHKSSVRDRLLHRALYRSLYPFFDRTFIADSFSCRQGKGTHKALRRFQTLAYAVSENHTRTIWVLKCDVRKFFASIDHLVLSDIVAEYIPDKDVRTLISEIIESFCSTRPGVGLPLGNLTSQLLVNIYMNTFDQFVKHRLKAKCYVRYADDFVILSADKAELKQLLFEIRTFLLNRLKLCLHPNKVSITRLLPGVDFLGWVHFSDHRVLRKTTKRRMWKRIVETSGKRETVTSYLGLLNHGNGRGLSEKIKQNYPDSLSL